MIARKSNTGISQRVNVDAAGDTPRNNASESKYWDSLFLGTAYEDLYKSILAKYQTTSPVNNFFGALTGKNAENAYNHEMAMNEELVQLMNKMYDEQYDRAQLEDQRKYDSPVNQAALNSAAGLNSDLLGVGSSGLSPASSSPRGDGPLPEQQNANPAQLLSGFISTISGAASFVLDSYEKGIKIQSDELDLMSALDSRVITDLSLLNYPKKLPGDDIEPAFKFEYNTGNKRLDKRLNSRISKFKDSLPVRAARYMNQYAVDSSRKDLFDVRSSAGFSDDDEKFLNELAYRIANMQLDVLTMSSELSSSSSSSGISSNYVSQKRKEMLDRVMTTERGFWKWIRNRAEDGEPIATKLLLWATKESETNTSDLLQNAVELYKTSKGKPNIKK